MLDIIQRAHLGFNVTEIRQACTDASGTRLAARVYAFKLKLSLAAYAAMHIDGITATRITSGGRKSFSTTWRVLDIVQRAYLALDVVEGRQRLGRDAFGGASG